MSTITPTYTIQAGVLTQALLSMAVRLFDKRGATRESYAEQKAESRWEAVYRDLSKINFAEIFSTRLTNYALSGSSVTVDNDDINTALDRLMVKSAKWCPLALGVGRVYLVPYSTGGEVYTDIIPQSSVISTSTSGDDVHGFICVSDVRTVGKVKYARLTEHFYDNVANTYTVRHKAVRQEHGGGEVPLTAVPEWADIVPEMVFSGVDKRPFGYVDSPKDSRDGDRAQGASIMIGCEDTIAEIRDTIEQYRVEFDNKKSVLGVNRSMLDRDAMAKNGGYAVIGQRHIMTEGSGRLGEGGDLFSVYSPDIRNTAFEARLLNLFARLEKQVGTSSGILTPADTSMATATQVRRAMYDTFAMVDRIRKSVTSAIDHVTYGYQIMLDVNGVRVPDGWSVTYDWSDDLLTDSTEQFAQISQGHSAGVVSDVEYRRFFFPDETPEEAEKALEEIARGKADNSYFDPANADGDPLDGFGEPQKDDEDGVSA